MAPPPEVSGYGEDAVVGKAVRQADRVLAIICCVAALVLHVCALQLDEYLFGPRHLVALQRSHWFYIGLCVVWWLTRRWTRIPVQAFALANTFGYIAFFGLLIRDLAAVPPAQLVSVGTTVTIYNLFVITGIFTAPYARRGPAAVGLFSLALSAYATAANPHAWMPWTMAVVVTTIMAGVQRDEFDKVLRLAARTAFRGRLAIAPAAVIREITATHSPLETAFAARPRRCVCLSTDWREFQALTRRVSAEAVAESLTSYYTMCDFLLHEAIPRGNYLADWFADELFVVVFAMDERETLADLAAPMLDFARRLLVAKEEFCRLHSLPQAIDIGVAGGEALLGMMGPAGFRKATAMGDAPERARGLQNAAKALRRLHGDCDRIVVAPELAAVIDKDQPLTAEPDGTLWTASPVGNAAA